MPPHRIKTLLVMHVLLNLCVVAGCVGKSSDWGLKQELVTALAHTQLLEHAARALLHVAQATPAASSTAATGTATATGPTDEDWACVSQTAYILFNTVTYLTEDPNIVSLCPRPRENDTQYDATQTPEKVRLLEQLRPLLAGRCVQVVLAWAGLCAVVTAQQRAGGGGSGKEGAAPARSQLGYGLPPELMRPLQPLQQVETPNESSHMAAVAAETLAAVLQATVSGPCDLAIAQPPLGYDRLPHRQPQPQRPSAGPSAAGSAAPEGPAAVPYSAVHAYGLLKEVWYGLACDSSKHMGNLCTATTVMARLLTEMRPRQAAVLLPGWWRLLAQKPSMLAHRKRVAQDAGELLRLQLNAPPPAAWAAGVTDAASVAAASVDWPPEPVEVQSTEAAIAAKAAASLARGRDPSYSLRCALDAGLLSAMERCLRAPQAWRQADSASNLLYVVNCALRYSGVWPAVLARGLLQQAVSLIATMGAAARLLEATDTLVDMIALASQPGTGIIAQRSAWGYLCTYLAAMLEQVADVRALRENAQQQQREGQQEQGRPEQQPLQQAHTDAAAIDATAASSTPLHLNSVLEQVVDSKDGSVKPSTCSIAWMAAAGGLPAAGSAADRQQRLLASFAVYQWLPTLAKATEDALRASIAAAKRGVATERRLSQALLTAVLDLLQSYWTLFEHMARAATQSWAKSTARRQQQLQQQQQPPPPELVLQCLAPLPVQQLAAAHGRQDIVDYLDALAEGVREVFMKECGQVQAGLHDLMVAEAAAATAVTATGEPSAACGGEDGSGGRSGSSSNTTSGGRQGSSSGGPVFEHKLCCNPHCCSLDGPSALIPSRSGKTCVRCRAATYCCGACQLADWRERHSGTCSGAAAVAAGGAAKAGAEKA
eukprot:XP_001692550.1 predicted protein [Chlamydomonas reinhardtii]